MLIRFSTFALAVCVLAACSGPKGLQPSKADVPMIAENFMLRDQNGDPFELFKFDKAPAIILMSQIDNDPVSEQSIKALRDLQKDPVAEGAVFVMINTTDGVTRLQLAQEAKRVGAPDMRFLLDHRHFVSETLGVTRGGEVFVIDPRRWAIVYHGPVDDRFAARPTPTAQHTPVKDALTALAAGQGVAFASYEGGGAPITYPPSDDPDQYVNITYTGSVAQILLDKCTVCHVPNGVAPFAMTDYATVRKFAYPMRREVRTGQMPPVNSDRHDGPFAHVEDLTDEEARTLVHWAEGGAARGEGDDLLARMVRPLPTAETATAKKPAP